MSGGSAAFHIASVRRASRRLVLAITLALMLGALVSLIGASMAAGAVGSPFTCESEIDFLTQTHTDGEATKVYESGFNSEGLVYNEVNPKSASSTYDALGYDPTNDYLYSTELNVKPSGTPGTLFQIDNTGTATALGVIKGYPAESGGPSDGAFDPEGNYWITNGGGSTVAYEIDISKVEVIKTVKLSRAWQPIDFSYYEGYMWGLSGTTIYRLNLSSGEVTTYSAPSGVESGNYGAAWTFSNGDLGFSNNATGGIFKIEVKSPATPTFSLLTHYTGPVADQSNDGAACIAKEGCPEGTFQVTAEGKAFTTALPAHSVATYRWRPESSTVESWITTPEEANRATPEGVIKKPPLSRGTPTACGETISVGTTEAQEIDGFGGAMTESAAYVIKESANATAILERLFSPPTPEGGGGAGFDIARVPIGPSDFTVAKKPKPKAAQYLSSEMTNVVPVLQAAESIEPGLKSLGTPWSAPGEWKIGKKLTGSNVCSGSNDYLAEDAYGKYAEFLAHAAELFETAKIPLWMLSLQNEPHNCQPGMPTMKMEPSDEAALSTLLHEDLARSTTLARPPTLLGWDHNWNDYNNEPGRQCKEQGPTSYPEELLKNAMWVEALGFHGYCGFPNQLTAMPMGLREVPFYETESSGFENEPIKSRKTHEWEVPQSNAEGNLPYEVQHYLIEPLREGARGSIYWNLALNEACGPQYQGGSCLKKKGNYSGCQYCRPLITVDKNGEYKLNQDYFYWAQLSKFIRPGAHIIETSTTHALDTVAAKNEDGSVVLTVLSTTSGGTGPQTPAIGHALARIRQ